MKISLSQLRQLVKEAKEEAAMVSEPVLATLPGAPDVYEPSEGNYFDIVLKKLQKGEPLDHDPATVETVIQILNDKSARASIQREALESLNFMNFVLAAMFRDPLVIAETTEFAAAFLWRKFWPNDPAPVFGKELSILLKERLKYVIAYSSEVANLAVRGKVPIRAALAAAAKAVGPAGKTLAAQAERVAAKRAGSGGLSQAAKAAVRFVGVKAAKETVRRAGKIGALGAASIVLGAADIAILGVEHLGLDAMRASEYQSTLIKQMIDVHRNQYLYRKNNWEYKPVKLEGENSQDFIARLKDVIDDIETSLELRDTVDKNYTIMAPIQPAPGSSERESRSSRPVGAGQAYKHRRGGSPSWETALDRDRSTAVAGEKRAETPWWEIETDIPGEKSEDKNFEIAQRKLSGIPREIIQSLRFGVPPPDPLPKNWNNYKYLYDKYRSVLRSSMGVRWNAASAWIKVPDPSSGKMQIWIAGRQNDDIGWTRRRAGTGKITPGDYVETGMNEPQLRGRMRSSFNTLTFWTRLDYLDLTDKLRKAYRALAVAEEKQEKEQNVD